MLAFQPQTLNSISPTLSLEEAAHRVLGVAPGATDVDIYSSDPDRLADLVVVGSSKALFERLLAAYQVLLDSLRQGELHSYLWHPARDLCLGVPRLYWYRCEAAAVSLPFKGASEIAGGSSELDGLAPILAEREIELWVASGRRRLDALRPPSPAPVRRSAKQTPRQKGVSDFLRYYDNLENPPIEPVGKPFYSLYRSWCTKNFRQSLERSGFYEELARVRSRSAATSVNDNSTGS